MNMLTALKTDNSIETEKDSLGGGSYLVDSDIYAATVKTAYVKQSDGGAYSLVIDLVGDANENISETLWMTSGTTKGCKNYYMVKDRVTKKETGEKAYLPGFLIANSLALLTVGKELSELETEDKVIPVWDGAASKAVPTKVNMVTALVGQRILAGVLKKTVDKTAKNESTGKYEPTGETRDVNEVDKLFRERDGMTVAEILAEATEPTFKGLWLDKNKGKVINTAKGASASAAGVVAGAPSAAATAPKSIFS
jgi:hypothetical protein